MPSRNARRRAEQRPDHHGRLRRLKGVAIGASALLTMTFWWLVTGAVAQAQTTPTQTTTSAAQPFGDEGGSFFGGSSGPSLGRSTGFGQPMLRSGGS
jgi:hypothetical protein